MRPIQVSCRRSQYIPGAGSVCSLLGPKIGCLAPCLCYSTPRILLNPLQQDRFYWKSAISSVSRKIQILACICHTEQEFCSSEILEEESRSCLLSWQEILLTPAPMCRSLSCYGDRCWRRPWGVPNLVISMLSGCQGSSRCVVCSCILAPADPITACTPVPAHGDPHPLPESGTTSHAPCWKCSASSAWECASIQACLQSSISWSGF